MLKLLFLIWANFCFLCIQGQEYTDSYWSDIVNTTSWSNNSYNYNTYVGYYHGVFPSATVYKSFSSPNEIITINMTIYILGQWSNSDRVEILIDNQLIRNVTCASGHCTQQNMIVNTSSLFNSQVQAGSVYFENIQVSATVANKSSWILTLKGYLQQTIDQEAWGFNKVIIQSTATPTPNPTPNPTSIVTPSPTPVVTPSPTPIVTPSSTSVSITTLQPTYADCTNELKTFNWSDESNDKYVPYSNIQTILVNTNDNADISLDVTVTAEYLCQSYSNQFNTDEYLPITYVLDTSIFKEHGRNIYDPNSCENRLSSSFEDKTWDEYWQCSYIPSDPSDIGSTDYLSYPPANIWDISMLSSCGNISWVKSFTIDELLACTNKDNENTFQWSDTTDAIILSGYMYLTLISPLYKSYDSKYYNTYSLQQKEIQIQFMKNVYLLNNDAQVKLFGITNIAKYIDTDANTLSLIFMTWSANYVNLQNARLIYPTEYYDNALDIYPYSSSQDCTLSTTYRCYQLWIVNSSLNNCIDDNNNTLLDFSSDYLITTTFNCLDNSLNSCDDLYEANGNSDQINLDYSIYYQSACNVDVFNISFDGEIYWYEDSQFNNVLNDPTYQVTDTAYVEVDINNIDGYSLISVSLINVWLCTSSSNSLTVDSLTGIGGCFSDDVDSNLFQVFINGASYDNITDGAIISEDSKSLARFSFTVPSLSRYSFYIQVQVELELENSNTRRRERRLLDVSSSSMNPTMQFISSATVQESNNNTKKNKNNNKLTIIYSSVGGAVFGLLLIGSIIYYYKYRHNKVGPFSTLNKDLQTMVQISQPESA